MPKEGKKGPANALTLFFKDKVSEITKANPGADSKKDLARLVGVAWQALSAAEQEPYKAKASADAAEYEAQQKVCVYPICCDRGKCTLAPLTHPPEHIFPAFFGPFSVEFQKEKKAQGKAEGAGKKAGMKGKEEKAKRPLSGFMVFSSEQRETIKKANPEASFGEIGKLLGVAWGKLSEEEKAKYKPEKVEKEVKEKKKLTGFMVFSSEQRETIKKENPQASFGEIGKLLGVAWGKLSAAEKAKYNAEKKAEE